MPFSSTRRDPLQDRRLRASELGLYVMDTFRLTSNLTVDYGLRWDYFASPSYSDGLQYNWDAQTGAVIVPREALPSVASLYQDAITVETGDVVPNAQTSNFRPRLGVAYRMRDDLVLRGGYGVYTERLDPFDRANGGGPFDIEETYFNRLENGRPLFSFPNPFPESIAEATVPSQSVSGYPMTVHNGHIHQFNVSVEQQIADVGFRLSYVGSRSRGLNYTLDINKPAPSAIPFAPERRPYPQFVDASFVREDGSANYDSTQVEVVRRAGLITFNANYTWSSSLQNFLNIENPYDVTSHWSRDDSNPRHRAVISTMIELPWGRGQPFLGNAPAVVDYILGGWRVQTISYLASGKHFSPQFSGFDPSGTNTSGGLPDRVCDGNLPGSERTIDR
ncbi:MAG: TonB-dependent receptor, partial [Vicinamibacteraceae bacterium]